MEKTDSAIALVKEERERQDAKWGDQSGNHPFEWMAILGEEYGELCEAVNETCFQNATHPERGGYEKIIREATQVAAVSVAIVESMNKKLQEEGNRHSPTELHDKSDEIRTEIRKMVEDGSLNTDSDVYDYAEERGISAGKVEKVILEIMSENTPCHGCKHVPFMGTGMYPCNCCSRRAKDRYEPAE